MSESKRKTAQAAKIPAPQYVMDNPDFLRMAQVCAGMPLDRAMQAAFDMLAQCIGLATDDLAQAESIARQTGGDLARAIRSNWTEFTDARRLMQAEPTEGRPS